MISKEFFSALDEFEQTRNIKKEVFVEALETALTSAYKKHFGEASNASVKLDAEKCTIRIFKYKTVVEEVEDFDKEISLEEAHEIKKSYKVGDIIEKEVAPKDFGRIAAQTAKQVVMQKLREVEKVKTMSELSEKEDKLLTTVVRRIEGKNVYVEMGTGVTEGLLGEQDQIPGEKYYLNQRLKVYVKRIKDGLKGPQVQVSRANTGFVKKLFELEIPEIATGDVIIKNISREAGYRTKIAIHAENEDIDAIGACVGNKGMRINSIVNEMNGEKVDIVLWSPDEAEFIARALSPAQVISVTITESSKSSRAIVPDDKLSLAIGKDGQNARLAARLTGMKIDIKSASSVANMAVENNTKYEKVNTEETSLQDMFKDFDE